MLEVLPNEKFCSNPILLNAYFLLCKLECLRIKSNSQFHGPTHISNTIISWTNPGTKHGPSATPASRCSTFFHGDWDEIAKVACLIINQILSHKSKTSPYAIFKGRSLLLSYLKPTGVEVAYLIEPKTNGVKDGTKRPGWSNDWVQ